MGNLSVHDPADKTWRSWKLPGDTPRYSVFVDDVASYVRIRDAP